MMELSALMSVYNGEEFVAEAIESILAQTYSDFEFIIVNDGSTDRTREKIEGFKDDRIKLFNLEKNRGVGAALNYGLSKVTSGYVVKVDSDDISVPTRFEEQKKFLDINPEISIVGSFIEFFPHNEKVANSIRYQSYKTLFEKEINTLTKWEEIREKMYWFCAITHPSFMGKTEAIKLVGYEDFPMGTDYNLFYKLNKLGYKMANLPKVLVKMRVSESSITAKNLERFYVESVYRIKKDEIEYLLAHSKELYVWGAGYMGQKALQALIINGNGRKIKGFIDSDPAKQGKVINGWKIFSPDIVKHGRGRVGIIVASQLGKFEIVEKLEEYGYRNLENYLVYYY